MTPRYLGWEVPWPARLRIRLRIWLGLPWLSLSRQRTAVGWTFTLNTRAPGNLRTNFSFWQRHWMTCDACRRRFQNTEQGVVGAGRFCSQECSDVVSLAGLSLPNDDVRRRSCDDSWPYDRDPQQ